MLRSCAAAQHAIAARRADRRALTLHPPHALLALSPLRAGHNLLMVVRCSTLASRASLIVLTLQQMMPLLRLGGYQIEALTQ